MDNKPSGLRDGLDVLENTKDSSVIQPVVNSLYLLSYPAPLKKIVKKYTKTI